MLAGRVNSSRPANAIQLVFHRRVDEIRLEMVLSRERIECAYQAGPLPRWKVRDSLHQWFRQCTQNRLVIEIADNLATNHDIDKCLGVNFELVPRYRHRAR